MIEVFKTNVHTLREAYALISLLLNRFPDYKINFDLEDCDNILRIEGAVIHPDTIIKCITEVGFVCTELD